jgi:hypothetical protein
MLPDELSSKERAAMFALLAEARQLSNPELKERVGFPLDGKERRKLNDLKLVESGKVGQLVRVRARAVRRRMAVVRR